MKKKILITGSSGFISKKLSNYLKKKNYKVFCTSRNKNDIYYFDLKKVYNSKHTIPKFDILIHLAYFKGRSYYEEKKYNINGSKNIFSIAKNNNAKIIFISSQSANSNSYSNYGKIKYELESIAADFDAFIIRPGLIYEKDTNMGIFGKIETFLNFINNIVVNDFDNYKKIINLFEKENYNLEDLVKYISKMHNKKIKVILINYKIILNFLKLLEFFNVGLGLRADSLKSLIR